jgi:DNA-binding NarL/FixJ family response regulator
VADDQIVTVRGEDELLRRAGHLFAEAHTEFVCAATDMETWSRASARPAIASRMRHRIAAGLVARKLYTPAALVTGEQRSHLREVAAAGAEVRICPTPLPHETIIIDRQIMILAGSMIRGDREFTVTTAPRLIDGVHALFLATWDAADTLDAYLRRDRPQVNREGKMILGALASGLTDEAAARRLGIPLRTYRRRVAELMKQLESDSRFQAGLRVGELRLHP